MLGPMNELDVAHFRTFGFLVLRKAGDFEPLRRELVRSLESSRRETETRVARVQYVPMMTSRTPISLSLLDKLAGVAETLLGGPVLPVRAKGMRYRGSTAWHTDSSSAVASVGFAAYLDSLHAETGALRVLPGSHRREFAGAIAAYLAPAEQPPAVASLPGISVGTAPGDIIAFDEHIFHASTGGIERLQWRVDYVREPDPADTQATLAYFASIFPPEWDGGYDVDAYPSYGPEWCGSGRSAVAKLRELGVYRLADEQENFSRSRWMRSDVPNSHLSKA